MTKKFTAFLTALLCMTGTVLSLPVSAEYRIENGQLVGDISDFNAGLTMPDEDDLHVDNVRPEPKPEYTYTTDTFTYKTNSAYGGGSGFSLESELADPDFMVVGILYSNENPDEVSAYVVSPVNNDDLLKSGLGVMYSGTVVSELGEKQLCVGDLLKIDGPINTAESATPIYFPDVENTMSCIGNGVDLFGEEFNKVIRLQMVIDQTAYDKSCAKMYDIELVKGDVNVDDELSILDCLSINRNLLIGEPLCGYAKLAGDINENGTIDAVDSLSILKECINITENFE